MKKITLVLCLGFVGLIGMAQQTESSKQLVDSFQEENSIVITLNDHRETVIIEKTLINNSDFNRTVAIKSNNHELVHNTNSNSKHNFNFNQEAYSYEDGLVSNDYTLNYDFEPMTYGSERADV